MSCRTEVSGKLEVGDVPTVTASNLAAALGAAVDAGDEETPDEDKAGVGDTENAKGAASYPAASSVVEVPSEECRCSAYGAVLLEG